MSTILVMLSLIVLGIHLCHRDWKSPSVFAATAVLAAGLGAHPGLAHADELAADVVAGVTLQDESLAVEDNSAEGDQDPAPLQLAVEDESAEEEVPPLQDITDVRFPERTADSPDWLTETERWSDDTENVSWVPVHVDVELSKREAREALDRMIVQKTGDEMNRVTRSGAAARNVGYSIEEIRSRGIVDNEVVEKVVITSGDTVYQAHALLKFDESFEEDAANRWRKAAAMHRLLQTGGAAGVVFLLLGTLFGYFRLDTATRGYYTRRLQFATAGTILAVIAASVLAAKWCVPWM